MNNGSKSHLRIAVVYSELAADVRQKNGLYWTYLERGDNGNYDAFVDNVTDGRMWARVRGTKFVPPGSEVASLTFVIWREEGRRWVIDEISYPQA